jgi:hypothetical protein
VKCCWLFRKLPRERGTRLDEADEAADRNLPMFELTLSDSGFNVRVGDRVVSLREFVEARLQSRIRFREYRDDTSCQLHLVVCSVECWRRGSPYDVFYTRRILHSDCGTEHVDIDPGTMDTLRDDPHSALRNWRAVKKFFPTEAKKPARFS